MTSPTICSAASKAGLGTATVGANAVFAAVTGTSIASASVFTKVAVPEMLRLGYRPRFAVGVVAGSSVLGMLIPPEPAAHPVRHPCRDLDRRSVHRRHHSRHPAIGRLLRPDLDHGELLPRPRRIARST